MTADPTPDPWKSDYLQRPDVQGHLKVMEVLRNWDPIGVIAESNLHEYDGYSGALVQMLDAGRSTDFIAKWLIGMATDHMGLSSVDVPHTYRCAQEMVDFWAHWKTPPTRE